MSSLVRPVAAKTSPKIGTSISTPFVVAAECRSLRAWAKPITATSVMSGVLGSQVAGEGVVGRIRLAGRLEVVDVVRPGVPFLARLPDRPDPHPHPDVRRRAAEDQVLDRKST